MAQMQTEGQVGGADLVDPVPAPDLKRQPGRGAVSAAAERRRPPARSRPGSSALVRGIQAAFDSALAGLAVAGEDGCVLEANAALGSILGVEPEALRGQALPGVARQLGGEVAEAAVELVMTGRRRACRREVEFTRAGGERLAAVVTVRRCGEERDASVLLTAEDVSALRAAEQRAEELEVELAHAARLALAGELAAVLAHEITQPLAAIANYTSAATARLSRCAEAPPEAVEVVHKAEAESRRAVEVVRNLVRFLRKRCPERAPVDLPALVQEMGGMLRMAARGRPVVIRIAEADDEGGGAGLTVLADRVQLQQVVLNLVRNAAEAMAECAGQRGDEEGVLVRVWSPRTGVAEVSVRDGGTGLSPAALERLFKPFSSTKAGGLGLGLTICRSIVEAHGGCLWGENNPPPGPGATFRFTLPLTQGEASYDG